MTRIIPILLFLLSAFSAVLSPAAPAPHRAIKVVMDNNYPPYAFQDGSGKLKGILVDQWHLWSEKTGIEAVITGMNWGEAQRRMQKGEFDVIDTIFRNPARDVVYDFGRGYAKIDFNLFFHQDISGIQGPEDAKAFVVGVKSGGAVVDVLKQHGVENLTTFDSDDKLVEAGRNGKIKVFAMGHFSALYFLNKFGIADRYRETKPLFTGEFHRAVRKGDRDLLLTVEQGFAAITDAELKSIDRKWYGSGIGPGFPVRYIGYGTACSVGLIIFLLTWNRTLNRAIVQRTAEREKAVREIESQRALLTAIINGTNDAIFVKDTDGRYLMVNAEVERLFGMAGSEIVGHDDRHFFSADQAEKLMRDDHDILLKDRVVTNEEHLHIADGDRIYLATKGPIHGADGKLLGLFGISRDITNRIAAEEALRNSEERYRAIIESMQDVYFRADSDGRLVMVSPSGADILGYDSVSAMIGKDIRTTYYFDPAERDRLVAELLKKGHVSHYEITLKRRDGTPIPVATSSHLILDGAGNFQGVEGIFRDMTESRLLQEEREKSQRLESLGILAGGIAHDFNNILTGILGNVSLARRQLGEHPAAKQLKSCENAAIRASQLTQQLLTFARGGAPVPQVVDASHLLEESVSFVLHGARVAGRVVCAPGTWPLVADPGQMSQVIGNLLINAAQAMPEGGDITITTSNVVIAKDDSASVDPGRYVRIVIADTGCGIPPEHLPHIFDPYFTTKTGGSGLGLASVFSIVKRHGGTVSAASAPGEGATFTLLVPAGESPTQPAATERSETGPPSGDGVILVVDDEEMIRDLVRSMLEEVGYTVEACSDGREAVARHSRSLETGRPYAAIILDLTIPGGMGGKEAASAIRQIDTSVPLLVSSGYSHEFLDDTTSPLFDGAVKKPYTITQLVAEVARVTRPHRSS